MKSKFRFFGFVALMSVAAFTVQSCAKDYSDEIDDLQAQIVAAQASITSLQTAISAGKLVSSVTTVTNGYKLNFSDGTSVTITNGATGATGPAGTPGATGFTPIIGIDAQGYWTVIQTQGGTATRILVGGQPVLAKVTAQTLTLGSDKYLYIDGVKTSVTIPNIYYNDASRTLSVWVYTNSVLTEYKVPLAEDVVLVSDILNLSSPVANTKVLVNYGMVLNYSQTSAQLSWAGVSLGDILIPANAKLPVIVNPANATVGGYTFEIITADGNAIPIQGTLSAGWTGDFVQYNTAGNSGLYTLTLQPTSANIQAFLTQFAAPAVPGMGSATAEATQLAVRAMKGTRQITSPYQYSMLVKSASNVTLTAKSSPNIYLQIPSTTSLLTQFYTNPATDFYKVGLEKVSADANINDYLTYGPASPSVAVVQGGTSEDINSYRNASFKVKTMDFTGKYQEGTVAVKFYTPLTLATVPSYSVSYTIGGSQPNKVALTSLFTALDGERKLELWRNRAINLTTSALPAGVVATFYKADGTTTTTSPADVAYVGFAFTNSTVVPTTGTVVKLKFSDNRSEVSSLYTPFEVPVTITVSNPSLTALIGSFTAAHVPTPMWDGQKITLYGNNPSDEYDLKDAYVNFNTLAVSPHTYVFKLGTNVLSGDDYEYLSNRVNVTNNVDLKVRVYGNANNEVLIETIQVLLLSEIQQGSVVATQTGGVDNVLTVTHGSTSWKYFANVYSVKDYLGTTINAFDSTNPDSRLANSDAIAVTASGPNAGLIDLEIYSHNSGFPFFSTYYYDWRVRSHYSYDDPILTQASVEVPVTITITDDFSKTLVKNVVVKVVKP